MERIPYGQHSIEPEDIEAVTRVLRSSHLTQGPEVERFEKALAQLIPCGHAIAVCNGTAALHLALAGIMILVDRPEPSLDTISGPNPEPASRWKEESGVSQLNREKLTRPGKGWTGIVPAVTFAADANSFLYTGADVQFCDVDKTTGLIDLSHLEAILQTLDDDQLRRTIILPVSLNGRMPQLDQIAALARPLGCHVLEDAAHSLGGSMPLNAGGNSGAMTATPSGSCAFTDAAILSFHPVKHICCGEGGAVLTNDASLARICRVMRGHGIIRPGREDEPEWHYEQLYLGNNYRMTEMQAALGLSQLGRLNHYVDRRRELAHRYNEAFCSSPFHQFFQAPEPAPGHAWHLYAILFHDPAHRDAAYSYLQENNIGSQVHYRPLYHFPFFQQYLGGKGCLLTGAESYASRCLSIPLYPRLTNDQQDHVIQSLHRFCEKTRSH